MTRAAPALKIVDGRPRVSSLQVAKHFRKRHDNVVRDIKKLDVPKDFNVLNFEEVKYTDDHGEKRPAFEMTRDGFTLLAMGFTGKRAMEWKVAYIEAFNRMEADLYGTALPAGDQEPIPVLDFSAADKPITKKQFAKLNCAINALVNFRSINGRPITQKELRWRLAREFGLQELQDLPQPKFDEAREFVLRKISREAGLRYPESQSQASRQRQEECKQLSREILKTGHNALDIIREKADQALKSRTQGGCRVADEYDMYFQEHRRQIQTATELMMYSFSLISRSIEMAGEAESLIG